MQYLTLLYEKLKCKFQKEVFKLPVLTYDIDDYYSSALMLRYTRLRKIAKAGEIVNAALPRLFLGVAKEEIPHTYVELLKLHKNLGRECQPILNRLLSMQLENGGWAHPYLHHGSTIGHREKVQSCLHHTIRVLDCLVDSGMESDVDSSYLDRAITNITQVHLKDKHYSYYPDSEDNTINIQAEVASLLVRLGVNENFNRSLLLDVINECKDGLWPYSSQEMGPGANKVIDVHHNAMILSAIKSVGLLSFADSQSYYEKFKREFYRGDKLLFKLGSPREARLDGYIETLRSAYYFGDSKFAEELCKILLLRWKIHERNVVYFYLGRAVSIPTIRFGQVALFNSLHLSIQ